MDIVAQHLMGQAVAADQFGDAVHYRIVAEALPQKPGAIAARQQNRQEQNRHDSQATPETAMRARLGILRACHGGEQSLA
jgi:hypothetical protein